MAICIGDQAAYVYTVKQVDEELEQRLSEIDEFIRWNYHLPRILRLINKTNNQWDWGFYEHPLYINEFKNKPKYTSKEAHLDY